MDFDNACGVELHKSLSHLLDEACCFLKKATMVSKRYQRTGLNHDIVEKLEAKETEAKSKIQQTIQQLSVQLNELQQNLEKQLKIAAEDKEKMLSREYNKIMQAMKDVVTDCNAIEILLEKCGSDPDSVIAEAPPIIERLLSTIKFDPEACVRDVLELDFIQLDVSGLLCASKVGYVKCLDVDIDSATFLNISTKAVVNIEEIVIVRIAEKYVLDAYRYINAEVTDPMGKSLMITVHDNQDGTFDICYTPEVVGNHMLKVFVFDAHLPGSPFTVSVDKMVSDSDLNNNSTFLSNHKFEVSTQNYCASSRQPPATTKNGVQNCDEKEDGHLIKEIKNEDWNDEDISRAIKHKTKSESTDSVESFSEKNKFEEEMIDASSKFEVLESELKNIKIESNSKMSKGNQQKYGEGIFHDYHKDHSRDVENNRIDNLPSCLNDDWKKGSREMFQDPLEVQSKFSNTLHPPVSSVDYSSGFNRKFEEVIENNKLKPIQNENKEKYAKKMSTNQDPNAHIVQDIKCGLTLSTSKKFTTSFVQRIGSAKRNDNSCSKQIQFPIGNTVSQATNNILVCGTRHNVVKGFNWTGDLLFTLDNEVRFDSPSAVVTDKTGNIYVKDNKCIRSFTSEGKLISEFGENVLKRPYGLVLAGDLLVTVDERLRAIVSFDIRSGSVIESSEYEPLLGASRQSKVRFLSSYKDILMACDLGENKVYMTDLRGNLKKKFGSFGFTEGTFNNPAGITCDAFGNMVIADRSHNVLQIFSADGEFAGVVELCSPLQRPSDLHLTDDGFLLCSDLTGHAVNIYKMNY